MGDRLERTDVSQAHHDRVTSEIPITVSDDERLDMFSVYDDDDES
jgi:hypothetical protein